MAEGKSGGAGLFAKQVQKRFSRAQEKVRRDAQPQNPLLYFTLQFFSTAALRGWHNRHHSAPMGAHRVLNLGASGSTSSLLQGFGLDGISPEAPKLLWQLLGSLKVGFFHPKRLPVVTGGLCAAGIGSLGLARGDSPQRDPMWGWSQERWLSLHRPRRKRGGRAPEAGRSGAILSCFGAVQRRLFPFLSPKKQAVTPILGAM